MELLKPEHELRAQEIDATIVVFGNARIKAPEDLAASDHPAGSEAATGRSRDEAQARLYEEAHRFAHIVSSGFQQEGRCDFVVITGGPCIMDEAEEIMTALERFYTGWMPGGASQ